MNWTELLYYFGWLVLSPCLVIGIWRIAVGPTTLDRMIGFDLLTITVVALMVIFSVHERTGEYLELIIIVTALGFFSTVAYFYYLAQLPAEEGELIVQPEDLK
jgi:multisubunit Na+/H+ antiporter MnhF subunit